MEDFGTEALGWEPFKPSFLPSGEFSLFAKGFLDVPFLRGSLRGGVGVLLATVLVAREAAGGGFVVLVFVVVARVAFGLVAIGCGLLNTKV